MLLEGEHEQGKKGRGEGVMSLRAESARPSREHRPYQVSAYLSVLSSPMCPHFVDQLLEIATLPWLCSEPWKERGLCPPWTSEELGAAVTVWGLGLGSENQVRKSLMGKRDTGTI